MKMEKSCWGKEEGVLGLGTLQRKKIQKSGWVGPGLTRNFLCGKSYQNSPKPVLIFWSTRRGPCQHGFMCGCEQWSNNISESNYNMQPITIKFAVRVGPT